MEMDRNSDAESLGCLDGQRWMERTECLGTGSKNCVGVWSVKRSKKSSPVSATD